jgi:hypothetical protein
MGRTSEMGIAISIIRAPVILVIFILIACIGLSAFATTSIIMPTVDMLVGYGIRMYDDILPEIKIQNGKASVSKQQPFLVDKIDEKYFTVIIDTRDGKQGEALNYLNNVEAGLVLTQDAVVTKNNGQIRVIPLKAMPDIVLNAATLRDLADKYLPYVKPVISISATIYFIIVKPIQMLILALIPFLWASSAKTPISYGQALKISIFGMIPPVLLEVFCYFTGTTIPSWFYIYFVFYAVLMVLAAIDLVKSLRAPTEPSFEIQP